MTCIKDRCRSPVACGGFGCCRVLRMKGIDRIGEQATDAILAKSGAAFLAYVLTVWDNTPTP